MYINKMYEFYMIFARKNILEFFEGQMPLPPCPLRLWPSGAGRIQLINSGQNPAAGRYLGCPAGFYGAGTAFRHYRERR